MGGADIGDEDDGTIIFAVAALDVDGVVVPQPGVSILSLKLSSPPKSARFELLLLFLVKRNELRFLFLDIGGPALTVCPQADTNTVGVSSQGKS
jgi:hypothetical protein